jgi:hypothetical protein
MNKHLSDGNLRAALDRELAGSALQHLETCPACQQRLEQLRLQVQSVAGQLSFLAVPSQPAGSPAREALKRFQYRNTIRKENPMFKRMFSSPLLRIGLVFALIVTLVLSIPATRALADQLLNLFRVQQVVVVPVDASGLQQLTGNSTIGKQFSQLVSGSVTNQQDPGTPQSVADASQASQAAGFNVRLPQGLSPSRLSVEGAAAFSFKVDRTKAQALLNEAGRSDLVLPASIDGADVSVAIPANVSAAYGTCPDPTVQDGMGLNGGGSPGRNYPDCVILAELPSPVVSAPADLNIAQLAQIGLEFTGMSHDQAVAFTQSVDWTSSLVVPIPRNAATYQQVQVDGVTGTLIQRPADDAPQYVLLWVKDGIIYAIGGLGTDSQKALQMAASLP